MKFKFFKRAKKEKRSKRSSVTFSLSGYNFERWLNVLSNKDVEIYSAEKLDVKNSRLEVGIENEKAVENFLKSKNFSVSKKEYNGLARPPTLADDIVLYARDTFDGNLNAEVAAGNHNAVGGGNNLVDVVHAFLILDFGNDVHGFPCLVDDGLHGLYIRRGAHETVCNKIHIHCGSEADVANVFFGKCG